MEMMPDGTVLPSQMTVGSNTMSSSADNDFGTHTGEIQRVIWPGDPGSRQDQRFVEYEVMCSGKDPLTGESTSTLYRHCRLGSSLGGAADNCSYTLRGEDSYAKDRPDKTFGLGYGSKVLITCIEGNRLNPIIIGSIRDEQETEDKKEDGHHLSYKFNGISVNINNDGELLIKRNGPTKHDGQNADGVQSTSVGGFIQLDSAGNIVLDTESDKEKVKLNHTDKKVEIESKEGQIAIKANQGVMVNDATDFWLKGTTYRNAQQKLHQTLIQQLMAIGAKFGTVTDPITATAAMISQAPAFIQMANAIIEFENNSSSYLSTLNKMS